MNSQLQSQLNDSKELNKEQQNKIKELENLLQKQYDDNHQIKGHIVAKIEKGLLINAEINLTLNNSSPNTSKSKFIFGTIGEKLI